VSYIDTDSINCPVQCIDLVKPFISEKLGDLQSDYDAFERYITLPSLVKNDTFLLENMEKTAIECYYVAPKTYASRVIMAEKRSDGKMYYCYKDHVRAKGVPKNCKPSMDDIKNLYYGNPVKYYTTIKDDHSLVSFIHSKGNCLGQKRVTTVKEIMPRNLNTSKYYYAEGGSCIAGHYRYDELPILISGSLPKDTMKMYMYDESGNRVRFDSLRSTKQLHLMNKDEEYREGTTIRCRIYNKDEPSEIIHRPCNREIINGDRCIKISKRQ
jgi:hypothetical protein